MQPYTDELEKQVGDTLSLVHIEFERKQRLDFYLPKHDVYIEVKKYHSERSCSQLSSQDNIILLQGSKSVNVFCELLKNNLNKK